MTVMADTTNHSFSSSGLQMTSTSTLYPANLANLQSESRGSEAEPAGKDSERLSDHHMSVVEREIRQQKLREQEVINQHRTLQQQSSPLSPLSVDTSLSPQPPQSAPSPRRSPSPAARPVSPRPRSPSPLPVTLPQPQASLHPEAGGPRSPEMTTPSPNSQDGGEPVVEYSEAISRGAHPGESRIARELREQREREEELRRRWKEMGLETPLANQDPPDTPYNRPDPPQPKMNSVQQRGGGKPSWGMSKSVSEPVQLIAATQHIVTPTEEISVSAKRTVNNNQYEKIQTNGDTDPRENSIQNNSSSLDQDDTDSDIRHNHFAYMPQNETPIEREMRLAREREEELRRVRGLPVLPRTTDDTDFNVEVTAGEASSRPQILYRRGDEGQGGRIRKFASSRLQWEIEQEKRRELALKSGGQISTISEERSGPAVKYTDVIPKENAASGMYKFRPQRTVSAPATPVAPPPDTVDNKVSENGSLAPPAVEEPSSSVPAAAQPSASRVRPQPAVLRRYSHNLQASDAASGGGSPAESRIERELREMKEREEELRSQQKMFRSAKLPPPPHHHQELPLAVQDKPLVPLSPTLNGDGGTHIPLDDVELLKRQHSSTSSSEAKSRRKSALAEEWERKFGNTG